MPTRLATNGNIADVRIQPIKLRRFCYRDDEVTNEISNGCDVDGAVIQWTVYCPWPVDAWVPDRHRNFSQLPP